MPQFNVHSTLVKEGKVYPVGSEIELTAEQAEKLDDKVSAVEVKETFVPGAAYDESEFKALSAEDQKKKVEELGGDLKEVTNADSRWAFVAENQQ